MIHSSLCCFKPVWYLFLQSKTKRHLRFESLARGKIFSKQSLKFRSVTHTNATEWLQRTWNIMDQRYGHYCAFRAWQPVCFYVYICIWQALSSRVTACPRYKFHQFVCSMGIKPMILVLPLPHSVSWALALNLPLNFSLLTKNMIFILAKLFF